MMIISPNSSSLNATMHKNTQIVCVFIAFFLISNILIISSLMENPVFALSVVLGPELAPTMASLSPGMLPPRSTGVINDTDALILMTNFDRIRTQLMLTEQSLVYGDHNLAFAHSR